MIRLKVDNLSPVFFYDIVFFLWLFCLFIPLFFLFFFLFELVLLTFDGLQVSGSEEINLDILLPVAVLLEDTSENEDFSSEHPEDHSDGLGSSVSAGDDYVDEVKRGIGIAQSNAGDINVGGLSNSLLVTFRVSH